MKIDEFKVVKYPKSRIATFDVSKIGRNKHHIYALIEIDVSDAMELIRKLKSALDKQHKSTAACIDKKCKYQINLCNTRGDSICKGSKS